MTTDDRFDQSVSSWLEETASARLPERVLNATFERTRKTSQRGGWRAVLDGTSPPRFVPALGGVTVVMIAAALAFGSLLAQPKSAGPGRPEGIFAGIGGWIAFGGRGGIGALDPTRPDDPDVQVLLSSEPGTPKAWSPDGSKLLLLRRLGPNPSQMALFVLSEDGTETRLTYAGYRSGGDFSADGSRVVYASGGDPAGVYVIDADGGMPERLATGYVPTFSPDGTQIAYFQGGGDWGHSLRVMNSDGSGMRVVLENSLTMGASHVEGLDWSPDGKQLLFALDSAGVFVVGIDGSGLTEVSAGNFTYPSDGVHPYWSPDGSLISYDTGAGAAVVFVRRDGTPVQEFRYGGSGPWNPGTPE